MAEDGCRGLGQEDDFDLLVHFIQVFRVARGIVHKQENSSVFSSQSPVEFR